MCFLVLYSLAKLRNIMKCMSRYIHSFLDNLRAVRPDPQQRRNIESFPLCCPVLTWTARSEVRLGTMPWNPAPTAPRCPACNTSVFPAEAVMAADRKPFHKQCVKCVKCKKSLNPSTINEHKNQLFCKNCYDEIYMPQEYCSGTYGGIITPEDIKRREEEERKRLERAERAKRERRCPTCDMKVCMLIYILYNLDLTLVLS